MASHVNPKTGDEAPLVSPELAATVAEHAHRLDSEIIYMRDFDYDYFGFKTLERSYLLRVNGRVVERPQHMLMRVSVGIHGANIERAVETYHYLSERWFTHASPTLFNAGTPRPQLSSCFLVAMKSDSIEGIYDTLKVSGGGGGGGGGGGEEKMRESLLSIPLPSFFLSFLAWWGFMCTFTSPLPSTHTSPPPPPLRPSPSQQECACISKSAGGIGLHIHNIRAVGSYIRGTNGTSNGIVPMLRVFNDTARYVDQGGGKRKGAFAIYLEPWHADIFDFLDLRKNHGKEESRARDLFYGLWVNDEFMRRVEAGGDWSLFCPAEAPGLADVWGPDFDALYKRYEAEGRAKKVIKAQALWFAILEAQVETGNPYMMYKDACNAKSNQQNLGTIKCSNLCTEIVEYTAPDETAVCNLASIALPRFVREKSGFVADAPPSTPGGSSAAGGARAVKLTGSLDAPTRVFDFARLREVTRVVTRNLNRIIDINYYPVEAAERSNMRHRPIGIGVQGLADAFILLGLPFDSEEAQQLNKEIFETIYFAALEESCALAAVEGPYQTYAGSPVSKGVLQHDMWGAPAPSDRWDWAGLRAAIAAHGVRNSLLVAPMPTASTSQILGNNECFEPYTSNIYVRRVLSGEFTVSKAGEERKRGRKRGVRKREARATTRARVLPPLLFHLFPRPLTSHLTPLPLLSPALSLSLSLHPHSQGRQPAPADGPDPPGPVVAQPEERAGRGQRERGRPGHPGRAESPLQDGVGDQAAHPGRHGRRPGRLHRPVPVLQRPHGGRQLRQADVPPLLRVEGRPEDGHVLPAHAGGRGRHQVHGRPAGPGQDQGRQGRQGRGGGVRVVWVRLGRRVGQGREAHGWRGGRGGRRRPGGPPGGHGVLPGEQGRLPDVRVVRRTPWVEETRAVGFFFFRPNQQKMEGVGWGGVEVGSGENFRNQVNTRQRAPRCLRPARACVRVVRVCGCGVACHPFFNLAPKSEGEVENQPAPLIALVHSERTSRTSLTPFHAHSHPRNTPAVRAPLSTVAGPGGGAAAAPRPPSPGLPSPSALAGGAGGAENLDPAAVAGSRAEATTS